MWKALCKLRQNVEKQLIRINAVSRNRDLRLASCSERRYALLKARKPVSSGSASASKAFLASVSWAFRPFISSKGILNCS